MTRAEIHGRLTHDEMVEFVISDAGGDVRLALSNALKVNRALTQELRQLVGKRAYERAETGSR